MKKLFTGLLLGVSLVLAGCSTVETLTTWLGENDESMTIVRIAVANDIYKKDEPMSEAACSRAFHYLEGVDDARKIFSSDVLTLANADVRVAQFIASRKLNPVTSSILLDAARSTVAEYSAKVEMGVIPIDSKITFNGFIDAVEGVAYMARAGC